MKLFLQIINGLTWGAVGWRLANLSGHECLKLIGLIILGLIVYTCCFVYNKKDESGY